MKPRIATRAVIIQDNALLMVNAFPGNTSDLWCAPGGGTHIHSSLPENLIREVFEETGLTVDVGEPCLVNEFHDPHGTFHQIEIFFRAQIIKGVIDPDWSDPENIVTKRRFFTQKQMDSIRFKPSSLPKIAFSTNNSINYDTLEAITR